MKRLHLAVAFTLVAVFAFGGLVADAAQGGNQPGKLVFNMNIVGRPNDYNGNGALNGDRHTLFIPLKTDNYIDPCSTTGGQNNPDVTQIPEKGVRLNIVAGDDFAVLDGDATDKVGELQMVPSTTGKYGIYAVAKGKPGGCLDLESYVTDTSTDPDTLVFLGSYDLDRSTGKPKSINISNLVYGSVDYFADPYEDLFWQLYNNGLRVLNIRIYEIAQ